MIKKPTREQDRKWQARAKEMLKRPYTRVLWAEPNGGFSAMILEFPGCYTWGNTIAQAARNLEKAATAWIWCCLHDKSKIPRPQHGVVQKLHDQCRRKFDQQNYKKKSP